MGIATRAIPPTTGNLPARAPSGLQRLDPMLAFRAVGGGAILIDTRPEWQRRADGDIPGAIIIEGNHLQWLRPGLPGPGSRDRRARHGLARLLRRGVLVVFGRRVPAGAGAAPGHGPARGFQAWRAEALPVAAPG